jgi:putative membrane protein
MDTAPEPFLLLEADEAPRLEAAPSLLPVAALMRRRSSPALTGVVVLGASFLVLWGAWLVSSLFDRWNALGWIGLACLSVGLVLIGLGISRELRGLLALRRVDHLRAELVSGEMKRVRHAAQRWLEALPEHTGILPALAGTDAPEAILALLRSGPGKELQEATDVLGRSAALQSVAIVAATPSPALDVLTVGWCGVRLLRQVAALHGMRPGVLGTVALLQKTALAAASVAVTEIAVNAATHAVVSHPILRHLAGDVAGAGVAARRMIVLARAAAAACSPLPR